MSCANLKCSGTDEAKFPMVDVGQVTVLWAARGAVSCLEIFLVCVPFTGRLKPA